MQAQTQRKAPLGIIPTHMTANIFRVYAGKAYERKSLTFGEKEPLEIRAGLFSLFGPMINTPIKLYIDGKYVSTERTNWYGVAFFFLPKGISPAGPHTITCIFEGDFWFAPSTATLQIKTVKMETAIFKAYVDSVAKVSAAQIEAEVMNKCLEQEIGAVPVKSEADMERQRYILTMLVPTEETRTTATPAAVPIIWAIIALIASIVGLILSTAFLWYVIIVYCVGVYQCGVCGSRFVTCEALREHLISQHPAEWEKIKDRFECAPPPPLIPPEISQPLMWVLFIGVGVAAAIVTLEIIKALRRK